MNFCVLITGYSSFMTLKIHISYQRTNNSLADKIWSVISVAYDVDVCCKLHNRIFVRLEIFIFFLYCLSIIMIQLMITA